MKNENIEMEQEQKIIDIKTMMDIDRDKMTEKPSKVIRAKRLSEITGQDAFIKVQAISGKKYTGYISEIYDGNGKKNMSKLYDQQSLIVVEGVVDPPLKNKELMEHFGAHTPKELVQIIFPGGELTDVYSTIAELSGYSDDEDIEDEIKN